MSTMNVSLPEGLKHFVDLQVADGGYGSASEYVRDLIRRDQARRAKDDLARLIREGLESGEGEPIGDDFWATQRERIAAARR